MEVSQELQKAKDVLYQECDVAYREALNGNIAVTLGGGKEVVVNGGLYNLWSLQAAYESLFIDPSTPETDASVKQADGGLIRCTKAEWEYILKFMRGYGKTLFIKNEVVLSTIKVLTVDNTMTEVWGTTWENISVPTE